MNQACNPLRNLAISGRAYGAISAITVASEGLLPLLTSTITILTLDTEVAFETTPYLAMLPHDILFGKEKTKMICVDL